MQFWSISVCGGGTKRSVAVAASRLKKNVIVFRRHLNSTYPTSHIHQLSLYLSISPSRSPVFHPRLIEPFNVTAADGGAIILFPLSGRSQDQGAAHCTWRILNRPEKWRFKITLGVQTSGKDRKGEKGKSSTFCLGYKKL